MPDDVNAHVQDANKLLDTTKKYAEPLMAVGVTAETIQNFETAFQDLVQKDTASKEAENLKRGKKGTQDQQISNSQSAIWKIRETAKIPYHNDKIVLRDFHIGIPIPAGVKALITELSYMKEVATRYFDTLKNHGITEADLANLTTCMNDLMTEDSAQETSKDTYKQSVSARNLSLKALKDIKFAIRKSADICFRDSPEIRDEFKSIIVHKKKKSTNSGTETTGESTTTA